MALHALDDLDDALDATRAFLQPLDRTAWLKLALVVFFIGLPGANVNGFQFSGSGNGNGGFPPGDVPFEPGPRLWLLIGAIVGLILLVALVFALIGSIMEFVLVESLRNEAVTVRRYWGRRWRQGVRLFGFRLVIGLFVLGSVALVAAVAFLSADTIAVPAVVAVVLLLLPVFLVLAIVLGLVTGFTTVFVVPIMIVEDCGVLDGWRRLWPTITAHWQQYLAYAVASVFLSILGGIFVGILTFVGALLLLVPFGVLFAAGVGLLVFVSEPVGIAVLVIVGILFALAILAVAAVVQVPVQTYLRYYALFVLGDVESDYDLIAERRAAVREPATS